MPITMHNGTNGLSQRLCEPLTRDGCLHHLLLGSVYKLTERGLNSRCSTVTVLS